MQPKFNPLPPISAIASTTTPERIAYFTLKIFMQPKFNPSSQNIKTSGTLSANPTTFTRRVIFNPKICMEPKLNSFCVPHLSFDTKVGFQST